MKPTEAGFDGENGVYMKPPCEEYPTGVIFKPLRGKKTPPEGRDLRNQLVWWYPDGQLPTLYYVNSDREVFELNFIPVEKPFVVHNTSENG